MEGFLSARTLLSISSMLFNRYSNLLRQTLLSPLMHEALEAWRHYNLPEVTQRGSVEVGLATQHLLLNSGLHQTPNCLAVNGG